jgi:hypothetical protein
MKPPTIKERVFAMLRNYRIPAAGALIVLLAIAGAILLRSSGPAYALSETVEALTSVRYVHIVARNDAGEIRDERWIEIGPDGFQARYRQDSPPSLFIVDDRRTVLVHYKDKNTVVLYDPKDKGFQWIGNLGQFFKDMEGEPGSVTIEENVQYRGRTAHRVKWLKLDLECYIDPESKLPIALGPHEITYEEPPEGAFEVVTPDGVTVVDKRPGAAPSEEPEWMKDEKTADEEFNEARKALASGEYAKAIELFGWVVDVQPRNWAWFWKGQAHYRLGELDSAVDCFSRVIEMFAEHEFEANYCHLARGLAYRRKGLDQAAKGDFAKALPVMIDALRNIEGADMFDYADDPLNRGSKTTDEESLALMIERLREVSGRNFGYRSDAGQAETERVIKAWENWWQANKTQFDVE